MSLLCGKIQRMNPRSPCYGGRVCDPVFLFQGRQTIAEPGNTVLEKNIMYTWYQATPYSCHPIVPFLLPLSLTELGTCVLGRLQPRVAGAMVQLLCLHPQRGTFNLKLQKNQELEESLRPSWALCQGLWSELPLFYSPREML